MQLKNLPPFFHTRRLALLAIVLVGWLGVHAQSPTSLSYPTPNVYIAHVNTILLSPNVAGNVNVSGYVISPAATTLPTGVTFNTNTGVISGLPTTALATTLYTITATGGTPSGTASTTVSIQVVDNFFNDNYTPVTFTTSTPIRGTGTAIGDTVLYTSVATLNGKSIDAFVITRDLSTGSAFTTYDQTAASGQGYSNNLPAYFSPQLTFPAGGGSVTFNFQFILGGSNFLTTRTAQAVTLQNVKVNTYDIDGNGTALSNQYAEFGGFDTSELGNPTTLSAAFNAATNLTRFSSTISTNSSAVTADPTRVRLTSNNISNFTIALGGGAVGPAYYVLDFSAGPAFNTAVKTASPSLDLNTTLTGVNNVNNGCGVLLPLSGGTGQTNIVMLPGSTLNELDVTYDNSTANLIDGTGETLVVGTGTPISTIVLSGAAVPANFLLSGMMYAVTKTITGNNTVLAFKNSTGGTSTFSLVQAEALLDALNYSNIAAKPSLGDRNFTVNVRNDIYKSPDAISTPKVTCVSISGNVYHDANALTGNGTVDANSTIGQLAANSVYIVLVNPTTNRVLAVTPIAAGGAYDFGKQTPGTYNVIIRNSSIPLPVVNDVITTATYPTSPNGKLYISTGENLGSDAGNDQLVDGILKVTVGSANITTANFGLELAPVTVDKAYTALANPGGFNNYIVPNSGSFLATDEDGTVSRIRIPSFPTNTNYLKIGNVYYVAASGSTCPPQIGTCVTWPGFVDVAFTGGVPAEAIAVDPLTEGATVINIPYTAYDNGNVISNASNVNLSFAATTALTISGNVWDDANADGINAAPEALTNAALTSQTLYAILVQTNTAKTYNNQVTIYASTPVSATTGYSFANVPANNDYEVHIVSAATAPVAGALASSVTPALATNYVGVSTNRGGSTPVILGAVTADPFLAIANLTINQTNINLGIEQRPVGANYTAARQANPGVATPVIVPLAALKGTDGEEGTYANGLSGRKVTINPATTGTVLYNGVAVTGSLTVTAFDPTKLTVLPAATGATTTVFTYSVFDNGNVPSFANTINVPFDAGVIISGILWDDANGNAIQVAGTELTPVLGANIVYAVLTDVDGNVIETVAVSGGAYSFTKASVNTSYKVVLSTTNAAVGTSLLIATLPASFVNTGTNLSNVAAVSATGIASITTAATALTNQNFGIEQTAIANAHNYVITGAAIAPVARVSLASTIVSGTYNYQITMAGNAANGSPTPGVLTGSDADGGATTANALTLGSLSGTGIRMSINPASYIALDKNNAPVTTGIMLLYNGVQLQPGGCQGGNSGAICSYYNATTSAWEIPNYDASLLTILSKTGVKSQSFQYAWVDAAGKTGATATYSIANSVVALPVELISFTATPKNKTVDLNWKVASESRLSGYVIERSVNATDFSAIETVTAHNTGREDAYQATDAAPLNGTSYYRLRIEEMDGTHSYAQIQTVRMDVTAANGIIIYPNPAVASGIIHIRLSELPVNGQVRIIDHTGKLLVQQPLELALDTTLSLPSLPAGIYMVEVVTNGQSQYSKLMIQE